MHSTGDIFHPNDLHHNPAIPNKTISVIMQILPTKVIIL